MKREEVRAIFPNATDEEVDAILNKAGGELNTVKQKLREAEAARDENAKQLEAKTAEGMSLEERIAAREKAAEERERDFVMRTNRLEAGQILASSGLSIDPDTASKLLDQCTAEDAEASKARAQLVVDIVKAQVSAAEAAAKDALLKANPSNEGGGGSPRPTTVKEFMALPYSEQMAMKAADPSILSTLRRE